MVRIKKNFLPSLFFNKLKTIVTSSTLPWYYNSQTVGNKLDKTDNHFMFTHVLYNSLEKAHSAWFKDFEPIIYFLDNKINEISEEIIVANHKLALSFTVISPLIIASGAIKALELIFSIVKHDVCVY